MKKEIDDLKNQLDEIIKKIERAPTLETEEALCYFHDSAYQLLDKLGNMGHIHKFPEGYKWCGNCDAVTPHEEGNHHWVENCIVCGVGNYGNGCGNCGWTPPEPEEKEPTVKLHQSGCHCNMESSDSGLFIDDWADDVLADFIGSAHLGPKWMKVRDYLKSINMYECSCPEVITYRVPKIFNYSEQSVYSMDCSNAMEWSYNIRCPVCGDVFDVSDGNC